MQPNVLLIVLDTARADAFEPYGAAPGSSPTFSELARRGGGARDARAPACWTVPSHASMFSGLRPRASGLIRAPGGRPHGCRPVMEGLRERLIPEVMRQSGYTTAAVSTNLWLTPQSGFATGFDDFVTIDTRRQAEMSSTGTIARARWAGEALRARADDGAAQARATIEAWLESPPSKPFFWFVNLVECHSPYLPPRPYNDLGVRDRLRAAAEAREHLTMDAIWRACAGGFDVPSEALGRMRHLYARAVRSMDDWLAAILERLDDRALLDDTLVIITSDHGENFGEGGLMGHAYSLDERLLRVPLATAGPGADRIPPQLSLTALPRSIAAACGIEQHPWAESGRCSDVAVAEFDPPATRDDPRVEQAMRRWGLDPDLADRITTPITAAVAGRRKLVIRGDREELYDLASDPEEATPLRPEPGDEVVERLRAAITAGSTTSVGPHPEHRGSAVEPSEHERRQLEERMRMLGYL